MTLPRNLGLAGLAFLLWTLAFNLAAPLLPLFALELGASPLSAGVVVSAGMVGALVLVFPLAYISDRLGRRAGLLAGWSLSAVGVLLMAGAPTWQLLLPGSFLSLAVAAALPILNTLALEESQPHQWARSFVFLYAARPLGLLMGSALGGFLAEAHGIRFVMVAAGISCAAAVLTVLPIAPGQGGGSRAAETPELLPSPEPEPARTPVALVAFAVVAALGFLVLAVPHQFIVPYLREVGGQSLAATGLYKAFLAAAELAWSVLFLVWPRTAGRVHLGYGPWVLSFPAATCVAVTLGLAANAAFGLLLPLLVPGVWLLALLLRGSHHALLALGSSLLGDLVAPGPRRTTRLTLFNVAVGVGGAGAPVLAGLLYGLNPAYPFWFTGAGAAVGAAVLALLVRRKRDPEVGEQAPCPIGRKHSL